MGIVQDNLPNDFKRIQTLFKKVFEVNLIEHIMKTLLMYALILLVLITAILLFEKVPVEVIFIVSTIIITLFGVFFIVIFHSPEKYMKLLNTGVSYDTLAMFSAIGYYVVENIMHEIENKQKDTS